MRANQRKNLLTLAAYLESLPPSYKHFDMWQYTDHTGDCVLPMPEDLYAAKQPAAFLLNCGTVACAVGHGPAAGIKMLAAEIDDEFMETDWPRYAGRVFGVDTYSYEGPFEFLFGARWKEHDNHHYGAAARIRYFLDTGSFSDWANDAAIKLYAPYRKGSRSAKRREIDAALAGEAGTAGTTKIDPVHEHATREAGNAQRPPQ